MKSYIPKQQGGLTVGQIVDAMYATGDFQPLGREDIFVVVEVFLKEYVGLPGTISTKKFTQDDARAISVRLGIDYVLVVKVITVFRIKAGKAQTFKQKIM